DDSGDPADHNAIFTTAPSQSLLAVGGDDDLLVEESSDATPATAAQPLAGSDGALLQGEADHVSAQVLPVTSTPKQIHTFTLPKSPVNEDVALDLVKLLGNRFIKSLKIFDGKNLLRYDSSTDPHRSGDLNGGHDEILISPVDGLEIKKGDTWKIEVTGGVP